MFSDKLIDFKAAKTIFAGSSAGKIQASRT
jgi:hypothetical protein